MNTCWKCALGVELCQLYHMEGGDCHAKSGPPLFSSARSKYIKIFGSPDNIFQFCWNFWTLRNYVKFLNYLDRLEIFYAPLICIKCTVRRGIIYFTWNIWSPNNLFTNLWYLASCSSMYYISLWLITCVKHCLSLWKTDNVLQKWTVIDWFSVGSWIHACMHAAAV